MLNEEELVVFSHNDADCAGCMLNIEYAMPEVKKVYFHTNYANISERVDEIEAHIQRNGNKHILIADVSFSTNRKDLIRLISFAKCTIIDHHLYPEGFFDDLDIKVHHSVDKSATLLCNEYFGNTGKNAKLDLLGEIINAYDIWLVDSPLFDTGQDFNEYFWKVGIEWLVEEFIKNDYNFPANYKSTVAKFTAENIKIMQGLENRNLIHRIGKLTVAFDDACYNRVIIQEMSNGQAVYVNANDYGIIRVRINAKADLTDEVKVAWRMALSGSADLGHMNAFTYKLQGDPNIDNIMAEMKKVIDLISKDL